SDDPFFEPSAPADAPAMYPELDQLPEFRAVERQRFEAARNLSTASYLGWWSTDSLVLSLDDESRRGFLQDMELLIESKYHGSAARNFVYEVIVAQRAS